MFKKAQFFAVLLTFALFLGGASLAYAKDAEVRTDRATSISAYEATLNGYVDTNDERDVEVWFEWGERSGSYNFRTDRIFIGHSSGEDFEFDLFDLNPDTTYYFRAVAQDDDGDREYGDRRSFTTDDDNFYDSRDRYYYDYDYNYSSSRGPRVVTYPASFVNSNTSVVLNGYLDTRDNAAIRWFEWGTSRTYMPNSTSKIDHGFDSGNFSETISGLQPNTTYYYRAVGQSVGGPVKGNIFYVTTPGPRTPVYSSPSAPNITPVTVPINPTVTTVPTVTIPVRINTITEPKTSGPVSDSESDSKDEEKKDGDENSLLPGLAIFGENFFPKTLIGWMLLAILIGILALIAKKLFGPTGASHQNSGKTHGEHGSSHEI